jgi:hypothetical protein
MQNRLVSAPRLQGVLIKPTWRRFRSLWALWKQRLAISSREETSAYLCFDGARVLNGAEIVADNGSSSY